MEKTFAHLTKMVGNRHKTATIQLKPMFRADICNDLHWIGKAIGFDRLTNLYFLLTMPFFFCGCHTWLLDLLLVNSKVIYRHHLIGHISGMLVTLLKIITFILIYVTFSISVGTLLLKGVENWDRDNSFCMPD